MPLVAPRSDEQAIDAANGGARSNEEIDKIHERWLVTPNTPPIISNQA